MKFEKNPFLYACLIIEIFPVNRAVALIARAYI